jgi:hypothetical protein
VLTEGARYGTPGKLNGFNQYCMGLFLSSEAVCQ